MIKGRLAEATLKDCIFRVKGAAEGWEFSKKLESDFETTMTDHGQPYVIVYSTKEIPAEFWKGIATDHAPRTDRALRTARSAATSGTEIQGTATQDSAAQDTATQDQGTKEMVLNTPVSSKETEVFVERELKNFPQQPLMSGGGPIIQPDTVQALLMMRKRSGLSRWLHDRIIKESVRYWVECAKLLSSQPTWLEHESATVRCHELVSVLGWFAIQEKACFEEDVLWSYHPYIADIKILCRALEITKHHPDDKPALGFVRDLRSIVTEMCPPNSYPALREPVRHCLALAHGRTELERAWQELLELLEKSN
jgi:hypothetical protein